MAYKQGAYTFVFTGGGGGGVYNYTSADQNPFWTYSLLNLQNVIKNQIHFNTSWRLEESL